MVRKCLLSTRRFSVEQRTYERPGADPTAREVVVHPGAVVILPLLDRDHIVMIRQYRHAPEEELWELPAGTLEPDEAPIDTARRELLEETGYEAGTLEPFIEFYTSPGILTERMRAFVATNLRWSGQRLTASEQIAVEQIGLGIARRKLIKGELRDAKSIAVLGTYFAKRDEQEAHA